MNRVLFSVSKAILVPTLALMMAVPSVEAKTYSKKECKAYAHNLVIKKYKWTEFQYKRLVQVWNYESHWNAKAYNKRTGACGIAQATPCSKMKSYGKDYKTNCKVQIRWGLNYIKKRYKKPSKAWNHIVRTGWY